MSKIPVLSSGVYYGRQPRKRSVEGIFLSESHHDAGQHVPRHSHSNAHFYLVLKGNSKEFNTSSVRTCNPGLLVYHPPEQVHANEWTTEGFCFCIELLEEQYQKNASLLNTIDSTRAFSSGMPLLLVNRLYNELNIQDSASSLAIEGITLELLTALYRNEGGGSAKPIPSWLLKAREAIHDQLLERLTLTTLAEQAQVHPAHLAKAFRQHFNCSCGAYIRKLRIEWACQQLVSTTASIGEIAQQAGFYDQSHFGRFFKKHTSISPNEYRNLFSRC